MNKIRLLLYGFIALAFIGCGGGGGGAVGPAKLIISPSNPQIPKSGTVAFSGNVTTGGSVTWTATQGTIVKTGPNTATYTAPNQGGVFQVTATSDKDNTIMATVNVGVIDPNAAIVAGFVYEANSTNAPILPVTVLFFDAGGAQVASVATLNDGSFTVEPPTTAVSFSLDPTSLLNTGNNNAYLYNNLGYTTLSPTCRSPLPPLKVGTAVPLPGGPVFVYPNTVVPPPPNGCK